MSVSWKKVAHGLMTKKFSREVEAYNWVVSICLKYVSLPWHMVNSPWRGASEPWAWREFYEPFLIRVYDLYFDFFKLFSWSPCCYNFLVACTQLYKTLCRSVGWSHFAFFMIFIFGPHCSCPNGLVTSNMAPAHPHATSVAVYLALFLRKVSRHA